MKPVSQKRFVVMVELVCSIMLVFSFHCILCIYCW